MGTAQGRTARAHTEPAELDLLVDGVAAGGDRSTIDLRELGPVGGPQLTYRQIDWAPLDNPGSNRVDVEANWGGKGRVFDDTDGTHPGLYALIDPFTGASDNAVVDPASIGASGLIVSAMIIGQNAWVGLVTAPTVSLGTNAPGYDNIIPATLMSLPAGTGTSSHYFRPHDWSAGVGPVNTYVPAGTTLFFRVHPGAAATSGIIRPSFLGLVIK